MGIQAHEVIEFQETTNLSENWHHENTQTAPGKIPHLFEQIQLNLPKSDGTSFDDLNDLGWFFIVLWSMLSIVIAGFMVPTIILNVSPAIVLSIVCIVLYRNGYQSITNSRFDEAIDHLEYLVISRMKSFSELLDVSKVKYNVVWMKTNGRMVLENFIIESVFDSKLSKSVIAIDYDFGLPSQSSESLTVASRNSKIRELIENKADPLIHKREWKVFVEQDDLQEKVRLVNLQYSPSWGSLSSMISSPTKIEEDSEIIRTILHSLYHDL